MKARERDAWCVVRDFQSSGERHSRTTHHAPRLRRLLVLVALLAPALTVRAQQSPHIGYVYPAGGRQGATFQVVVGGQFLVNATNAIISGDGIQAAFVELNRPMNQQEFNNLRDKWRELQERRRDHFQNKNSTNVWTTADEKTVAEIRAKMLKNPPNRQGTPAIAEVVTLKIAVATNAAPGAREIRLATPVSLSNPLKFCIGQLPEFSAAPAKAPNPDLERFLRQLGQLAQTNSTRAVTRISLPAVVNGQITPGGVDRFRFTARKGQRIVAAVSARELIPYLADAVPGWFQAAVSVSDVKGHELASDDQFRSYPDPVLGCEIPRDGDYVLQIRDSIYRGREDFVYRISIGELPFVTGIFPLGGPVGASTTIALAGWNLSATNVTFDNSTRKPGICEIPVSADDKVLNPVSFALDSLPEIFDQEPNDQSTKAQRVTPSVIVNGRIEKSGDVDVFSFQGKAGDEIVAEVMARRLNSSLDSTLELTDADGGRIAFNDDFEDKGSGLETHHADSYLRVTLPASGVYLVQLADAQRQGGAEFGYRLRISAPQPDFALRVAPSSISVRGGTAPVTAYVLRKDGFTNAISLQLNEAPRGCSLSGATIPANQDQVRFTLTVPTTRASGPFSLKLEGRAVIGGGELVHPAVPAEDMMQAFAYRHLVPAKELSLVAAGFGGQRGGIKISGATPVKIPMGGNARVRLTGVGQGFADRFKLELSEPPEGISLGKISTTPEGAEMEFVANAKVKAGLAGNFIVNVIAERPRAAGPGGANARRAPVSVLPAIPFEIVAE